MSSFQFSLCLLSALAFVQVSSMPNGAPPSACFTMTPGHGFASQSSPSPFAIEPANELTNGKLEVTIRASPGTGFKGFLLMAFDNSTTDDSRPLGMFTPDANGLSKANPCGSPQGALTHTSRNVKDRLVVTWTPNEDFEGFVVFKGSFVKSYNEYWIKERSPVVRVRREQAEAPQVPEVVHHDFAPVAPIVPLNEAPAEVVSFVPTSTATTTTTTSTTTRPPTTTPSVTVRDPIAVRTPAADTKSGNAGSSIEIMALVSVMVISFSTAALVA